MNSEDSNYFHADKLLLSKVNIPHKNIFNISTELSAEKSAEKYSESIKTFFKNSSILPEFDLVYLGMGNDGHTASLFPNTKGINESSKLVISVPPPKTAKPAVPRITMTYPILKNAKKIQFLISGESKFQLL